MSRLSRNIIYNLIGQGLLLLVGFVGVKYIFKNLGEEAFGIIQFNNALRMILYTVLGLGITSATTREISAHFKDDPAYTANLIRTASLFYWGVTLLLAVAIYFVSPFLVTQWINLKSMDEATAARMVQILGISSLAVFPSSLYSSLLRGLQRMEFDNLIDVGTTALQQLGTVLILALGGGLFDVVHWLAACLGLGLLSYLLVCARFFSFSSLVPSYSSSAIRRNIRYSSNMAGISLLVMVNRMADRVIMSRFLPIAEFGFYNFAYSVVSKIKIGTQAISGAAFPSFSSLFSSGDRSRLMAQYRKLQDLLCFASLPIVAAICFGALPLLTYLFNEEVAWSLLLPITLLSIGTYLNGTLHIPYIFSLATGRPDISRRQNFYALFVVLPIQVLLIYWLGMIGAGLSWVFYNLFSYAYSMPRICAQCLEIPASEWYRHVLKIIVLAGLTYGAAWAIVAGIGIYSISSLSLAYGAASVVYLAGTFAIIGEELRKTSLGLLQMLRIRIVEVL